MTNDNDISHGRHCVFLMHVHLVFVTKYHREIFAKAILDDLHSIFTSVCADFEVALVEFDGEVDPAYLLVNYPAKVSVPNLVNSLKGAFSRMIRKEIYPNIQQKLCGGAPWSPRCFPVAAAVPLSKLSADALNNSRCRIRIENKGAGHPRSCAG